MKRLIVAVSVVLVILSCEMPILFGINIPALIAFAVVYYYFSKPPESKPICSSVALYQAPAYIKSKEIQAEERISGQILLRYPNAVWDYRNGDTAKNLLSGICRIRINNSIDAVVTNGFVRFFDESDEIIETVTVPVPIAPKPMNYSFLADLWYTEQGGSEAVAFLADEAARNGETEITIVPDVLPIQEAWAAVGEYLVKNLGFSKATIGEGVTAIF